MKKVIGYISILVGFVLIASSRIPSLFNKLDFLPKIVLNSLLYLGLACFVFGIIIFLMNRNKTEVAAEEVPIYKGKQIVGYRRH